MIMSYNNSVQRNVMHFAYMCTSWIALAHHLLLLTNLMQPRLQAFPYVFSTLKNRDLSTLLLSYGSANASTLIATSTELFMNDEIL